MYYTLRSRPFCSLLIAQFLSALADNAVFIAAIAALKAQHVSSLIPILQACFLIAYVVLAPYVGIFADSYAKSLVMTYANILKFIGSVGMLTGLNPLLCYSMIGIGAALYSPAKYGSLPEMIDATQLIKANGLIESSTIIAIIAGVVLGGILSDYSMRLLLWSCGISYLLSSSINFYMPRIPAKQIFNWRKLSAYTRGYLHLLRVIWQDNSTRFSILGTSTFWAVGVTLRLILFAWIPYAFLNNSNSLPSNLMGTLSIGIAFGALGAHIWIQLISVRRALLPGIFIGPLVIMTLFAHHIMSLGILLILIGACGGMFIVPLNALLQVNGGRLIGTGRALAVQNFFENISMLLLITGYNLAQKLGLSLSWIIAILGAITLLMLSVLARMKLQSKTSL